MVESITRSPADPSADIRIMRLKGCKSPQTGGSDVVYTVHFELSVMPPPAWESIFNGEWLGLNPRTSSGRCLDAKVERGFLVIHCALKEIAGVHLPFLKRAVAATNKKYKG